MKPWLIVFLLGAIVVIFLLPSLVMFLPSHNPSAPAGPPMKKFMDVLSPSLDGVVLSAKRPTLSLHSWFSDFHGRFEKWYGENWGMRPLYVRLGNQIYYSLFRKSYMYGGNIIVGENAQLYEKAYIDKYCRGEPVPDDEIDSLSREMFRLQEYLRKKGIFFAVLITPSKANTYPEYLPDHLQCRQKTQNGYERAVASFRKEGVNYIDGQSITLALRRRTDLPLFCQGGTHWNEFAAFYTASAVIQRMEEERRESFKNFRIESVDVDMKPSGSDKDLASLLNLLLPPVHYPVPHPVFSPGEAQGARKPSIAFVGGSFLHVLIKLLSGSGLFEDIDHYYYYKGGFQTFPSDGEREASVNALLKSRKWDWKGNFLDRDAIFLEMNVEVMPDGRHVRGFLSDALDAIDPGIVARQASGIGVFRGGKWYLDVEGHGSLRRGDNVFSFGAPGYEPVTGDWNGDGRKKMGLRRGEYWYLDYDGNGRWDGCGTTPGKDRCYRFGLAGGSPVTGDWSGAGRDKIGIFDGGTWYVDYDGNGVWDGGASDRQYTFGRSGDLPVTGDWRGRGRTDIGVFSEGTWYLDYDGSHTWSGDVFDRKYVFGQRADLPVSGDWNGDGRDEIGVFREGKWFLDRSGDGTWSGENRADKDRCINFGLASDRPVTGLCLSPSRTFLTR